MPRHLVPRIAVFLLLLLGAAMFGGQPAIAGPLALAALAAAGWLAYGIYTSKPRDPYDLRLLKEIDERERTGTPEELDVADDAGILCPHCGNVYAAWMPICPRCKRSSHAAPF